MAAIIPAATIGAAVGAELPNFFGDAFDQFTAGEGIYLRDGDPSGVVAKIGQAVGRAYCRAYDSSSGEYPPGRGERIEKACRPYLDSIGSPGGPGLELPFRGGQCLCTLYSVRVDASWTDRNDGLVKTGFFITRLRGPLVSAGVTEGTGVNPRVQFRYVANNVATSDFASPSCNPAGTAFTRVIDTSQGSPVAGSLKATNVTVSVFSGGDNCGDPLPVPTLPPPPVNPNPPPFRFNPGPGIDIDINVDIGPGGDIVFDIGTGPITIDPFPGGGGGGQPGGDSDGPTGGDGDPGDVGTPGSPQTPGPGGEASGCAPEGSVLTGVKVDILEVPRSARQYAEGVYRGVCYAYLGVPGNLDHDPAGAMLRSGQFIFAEKNNLTCYAVRANLGFSLRVTPYYRVLEQD